MYRREYPGKFAAQKADSIVNKRKTKRLRRFLCEFRRYDGDTVQQLMLAEAFLAERSAIQ